MKKIVPIALFIVLVLQGLGAGMYLRDEEIQCQHEPFIFTDLSIQTDSMGSILSFKETTSFVHEPGKPYLPMYSATYTYPFGTRISDVTVSFDHPKTFEVLTPVRSLPAPAVSYANGIIYANDEQWAYRTDRVYPAGFSFSVDTGIEGENRAVFLNVNILPFAYDPMGQTMTFYSTASVDIMYHEPKIFVTFPDEHDMVIIAPKAFSENLQPLVDHKNTIGLSTFLKTTEDIYAQYPGVDEPEQIKYFIKDAIESFGINYVLLVGGRQGGIFEGKWFVPVRYSNVDDDAEPTFISDLYYSDIYNETGEFSSWDTNGNGIFAEFKGFKKDILGLIPDVYIGRLPCLNAREVKIVVDKIKTYETSQKDAWFNDMVVVGGDSAPGDQYNEGEEENKLALSYMQDFNGIRCWTSDGSFTGPDDVKNAISQGCGFVFFDGHANPASWSTHPPGDEETWITGLTVFDMPDLSNAHKFPVCVVGGCHIAQFDVSPYNMIRDIIAYGPLGYFVRSPFQFYHMEWVPRCWSWQLASMKQGGSIATLGFTGLDWFAVGDDDHDGIPDCTQQFSGFMNTHFFKNYGVHNITILGQVHAQTVKDYINTHPPMNFELDCKTVEEFVLLGDPSLILG